MNRALLRVPMVVLTRMLEQGSVYKITKGVADGARVVGGFADERYQTFWLVYEHESFPETIEGGELPELDPVEIQTIRAFD